MAKHYHVQPPDGDAMLNRGTVDRNMDRAPVKGRGDTSIIRTIIYVRLYRKLIIPTCIHGEIYLYIANLVNLFFIHHSKSPEGEYIVGATAPESRSVL